MTTIEITGGAVAAVIATGVYLRRGAMPVVVAYRLGRDVERLIADPARFVPVFRVGYRCGKRGRWRQGGDR
jgi:hypothetical protein